MISIIPQKMVGYNCYIPEKYKRLIKENPHCAALWCQDPSVIHNKPSRSKNIINYKYERPDRIDEIDDFWSTSSY